MSGQCKIARGCLFALCMIVVAVPVLAIPYPGPDPAPVPGTIEAENYNQGGEGTGYHDTSGGNSGGAYRAEDVDIESCTEGGYNVGWTAAGEWLKFDLRAASAGSYRIRARIASTGASGITLDLDGGNLGTLSIPNTGGWQAWQWTTNSLSNVAIGAGDHVLTVTYNAANFNLNYLDISQMPPVPTGRLSLDGMAAVGAAYATDGVGEYGPVAWQIESLSVQDLGPGLEAQFYATGGALALSNLTTLSGFNAWCDAHTPISRTLPDTWDLPDLEMPGGTTRADGGNPYRDASGTVIADPGTNEYTLARLRGLIYLPVTGTWTFGAASDDASVIFLDGYDTPLVNNVALQGIGTAKTSTYECMLPGWHEIVFGFYEETGDAGFEFYYQAPGGSLGFIPLSALHLGTVTEELLLSGNSNVGGASSDGLFGLLPPGQLDLRLTVSYGGETFRFEDQVSVIPEPATMALLAAGLVAVARRRRRQQA